MPVIKDCQLCSPSLPSASMRSARRQSVLHSASICELCCNPRLTGPTRWMCWRSVALGLQQCPSFAMCVSAEEETYRCMRQCDSFSAHFSPLTPSPNRRNMNCFSIFSGRCHRRSQRRARKPRHLTATPPRAKVSRGMLTPTTQLHA